MNNLQLRLILIAALLLICGETQYVELEPETLMFMGNVTKCDNFLAYALNASVFSIYIVPKRLYLRVRVDGNVFLLHADGFPFPSCVRILTCVLSLKRIEYEPHLIIANLNPRDTISVRLQKHS